MSAPKKTFKRIAVEVEMVDLKVPAPVVEQLDALAERLTQDVGFDVTIAQAIGWLLKMVTQPAPSEAEIAAEAERVKMEALDKEVAAHMLPGSEFTNKITAIKRVREVTGMSLKEAKDYVEHPRFAQRAPTQL